MVSTSLNLSPVVSSSSMLSVSLWESIPEKAQIAMLKVISLLNDIWVSITDCKKCLCSKTTTDIHVEHGANILSRQMDGHRMMDGLASQEIKVASVMIFKGEVVGIQCSKVNQFSKAAFDNHVRKAKRELESSLSLHNVKAWSPLTITTIFVGNSDKRGESKMRYDSSQLLDQNSGAMSSSVSSIQEYSAERGRAMIDQILTDGSKDPQNKKEKLKDFLFGKV